jgi:hypothetical protein
MTTINQADLEAVHDALQELTATFRDAAHRYLAAHPDPSEDIGARWHRIEAAVQADDAAACPTPRSAFQLTCTAPDLPLRDKMSSCCRIVDLGRRSCQTIVIILGPS